MIVFIIVHDNGKFPDTTVHYTKHTGVLVYTKQFLNDKKPENMHNAVPLFIKIIIVIEIILYN